VSILAERATAVQLADLLPATCQRVGRVFADTIGVMVAGARRNEIRALADSSDPLFAHGAGEARVLTPERPAASPSFAALVNGCACTALELDEGIRPTSHPAAHVVPAALAAGQALHASGEQLLAAVVSGYEVAARLFEAWRVHEALHPHGHLGAVGAAVAVARLRGAPPGPPALIAASLPLMTTWDACFEGATVRHAYTGVAAAMGIRANQFAAGLTGARGAQASAFGRLAGAPRSSEPFTEPVEPDTLRMDRNYFKFFSAGALSHSAITAVLGIGPMAADEIERTEVETINPNLRLARLPARNSLSARFSLPYAVAAAAVHGHARPSAFDYDPRTFALAERVELRAADDLEARWPQESPVRIRVHLRDRVLHGEASNAPGHDAGPVDDALRDKFTSLTGAPVDEFDRLVAVHETNDVATLFANASPRN
jgi:2-methylcitrate dehydratase PrpD